MVGGSIALLAMVFITAIYGLGFITGKPKTTAEFLAVILTALFLVTCVGAIILWKAGIIKI